MEGALAWVKSDSSFQSCQDLAWTKIDVKGEKGDAGAAALNGGNKIKFTISCSGTIQSTPYYFQYQAAEFLSGDVFVRANISDSGQDYSGSGFYSATQNGSLTAPVQIGFDGLGSANSGWWNLSLPRDTLVLSIVNSDQDIANAEHKNTWTMPTSACTKTTAP